MVRAQFDFTKPFASYFAPKTDDLHCITNILQLSEIPRFLKNLEISDIDDPLEKLANNFDGLMSIILNWIKVSEDLQSYAIRLVFKLMSDSTNFIIKNHPVPSKDSLDDNNFKYSLYIFVKICDLLPKGNKSTKIFKNNEITHDKSIKILAKLFSSKFWLNFSQLCSNDGMFLFVFEYLLSYIEIYSTPRNLDIKNSLFELLWLLIDLIKSPIEISSKIFANITYVQQAADFFATFFSINNESNNNNNNFPTIINEKYDIIIKYIFRELGEVMQIGGDAENVSPNTIKLLSEFIVSICSNPININLSTAHKLFQKIQYCDSPQLRQAVLVSFTHIIINKYQSDSTNILLDIYKNQLIDKLELHSLDISSMVRTKSMQCFDELIKAKLIGFYRSKEILVCIANSVYDDKVYVRKAALNALVSFTSELQFDFAKTNINIEQQIVSLKHEILEAGNPLNIDTQMELWNEFESHIKSNFDPKYLPNFKKDFIESISELENLLITSVNIETLSKAFYYFLNFQQVHSKKINMYENPYYFADLGIENKDWQDFHSLMHVFRDFFFTQSITPDTQNKETSCHKSILYVLEFEKESKNFLEEIVDACKKMLISESVTDISEAIFFLMHAIRINFPKSEKILASIISLYSLDQAKSIRDTIRTNFIDIYFKDRNFNENHDNHKKVTKSLIKISEIIGQCNANSFKDLIHFFVDDNLITDICIKQLIIVCISENLDFQTKISLLKMLNIIASVDNNIIVANFYQLIDHAISLNSLEFLYEVSHILITLSGKKDHKFQRFSTDCELLDFYLRISCENVHNYSSKLYRYLDCFITSIFYCFNSPFQAIDKFTNGFIKYIIKSIQRFTNECDKSEIDTIDEFSVLMCYLFIFISFLTQISSTFISKNCLELVCKENQDINNDKYSYSNNIQAPKSEKIENKSFNLLTTSKNQADVIALNEKIAEKFDKIMEYEILNGQFILGILYKIIICFIEEIKQINDESYESKNAYDIRIITASYFSLSKFCLINQSQAKQHLPELFRLFNDSSLTDLCINLPLCFADICSAYPVIFDTDGWKSKLCDGLKSKNSFIRINTLYSLSWLISKDIFKIKGNVFIIAQCLTDTHPHVVKMTKAFFKELSEKGNQLYNIMVDILTYFTEIDLNTTMEQFHDIVEFFFNLLKTSTQIINLIEIICQRMNCDQKKETLCRLSYCLNSLPKSDRGLKKIIQAFDIFSHSLIHKEVEQNFLNLIKTMRLLGKNDSKQQIDELENLVRAKIQSISVV